MKVQSKSAVLFVVAAVVIVIAIAVVSVNLGYNHLAQAVHWGGEWDPAPLFWAAQQKEGGMVEPLPESYLPLLLPVRAGEYVYVGGNQPWRGLRIEIEVPNARQADLVSEYWDGRQWRRGGLDGTQRNWTTLSRSGDVSVGGSNWSPMTLPIKGATPISAYWVRFSVTADLDQATAGAAQVIHNAPVLLSSDWELLSHRRSACENRPGLSMIRITVLDKDGLPLKGVKVGFDTEPARGIAYDHPDIWGLTDENGYLEWNHFGVPTQYRLWAGGVLTVVNIRTDLGNEYCGTGLGSWRPVNLPGIYSWDILLQQR